MRGMSQSNAVPIDHERDQERARVLRNIIVVTLAILVAVHTSVVATQPRMLPRSLMAVSVVGSLGLVSWLFARNTTARIGAWIWTLGLVALLAFMARDAGGIRSPGITSYLAVVLMAGVLLSPSEGVIVGVLCSLVALSLVWAERLGLLPAAVWMYEPLTLWLLSTVYMALVILLQHMAGTSIRRAFGRATKELEERKRAEAALARQAHDLGERVKELRLLHGTARVLQRHRELDTQVVNEIVQLMPPAWLYPEVCEARIVYLDAEVATAGWQESAWRLSAPFDVFGTPGTVEVCYRDARPPQAEGVFLAEERALIDSLAEMLKAHGEREQAERQRRDVEAQLRQSQKLQALGTLAGGIAHDFNNLLMAIKGNAELAGDDLPEESPARESLSEILRASVRAQDLVRHILLFSRKREVDRYPVQLTSVVQEAVRLLRASLPAMIEIQSAFDKQLPPVLADASQLHQVIMNLGMNAGHAMRRRGGVLRVTIDAVEPDAVPDGPRDRAHVRWIRLSVSDTGTGMNAEVQERIFEPFFSTKGSEGTGLGLSVVHGIVREHDGIIEVESALNVGTTFRVYFPEATLEAEVEEANDLVAPKGLGQHIMVLDDEQGLVLLFTRMLTRLGYRVTGFTTPASALQALRVAPDEFDAAVVDYAMPLMNGIDVARAMHAARPDMPLLILSGSADEGFESQLQSLEGTDIVRRVLSKPIARDALAVAMHETISASVA